MTFPAIKDKSLVSSATHALDLSIKEPAIAPGTTSQYMRGDKTWQTMNKSAVGLSNVDNTSDADKPVSTAMSTALGGKINNTEKGAANGVATLGSDSKVPSAQLPSYVDDVIEYATKSALPATGDSGKIYLVLADETRNNATEQYRWSGSVFTRIPTSPGSTDEVTEGATRLYFTENRVRATILTGLSLVTNVAIAATDTVLSALGKLQKQITDLASTVTGKENSFISGTTDQYFRGDKSWRDFATDVRGAVLTGLNVSVNSTVLATDTLLAAIGKLQKQVDWNASSLSFKEPALATSTTDKYYRGDKSWQDLASAVRIVTLNGLSTVDISAVSSLDSVLTGIGKLQAQFTNLGISKPGTYGSLNISSVVGGYAGINFTGIAGGGSLRDNGSIHSYWRSGTGDLWTCDNTGLFLAKNDVGSSSDETLKTNWRNFNSDFIKRLAKVQCGIYDRVDIEATQVGVSAQSILREIPDLEHAVHEGPDGKLTFAYANAAMVSAVELAADAVRKDALIAQQSEMIQELIARVVALENKTA